MGDGTLAAPSSADLNEASDFADAALLFTWELEAAGVGPVGVVAFESIIGDGSTSQVHYYRVSAIHAEPARFKKLASLRTYPEKLAKN